MWWYFAFPPAHYIAHVSRPEANNTLIVGGLPEDDEKSTLTKLSNLFNN